MGNRYGLIGVAGFVAPRHLRAIRDTGGELICCVDPSDSVGVMDSYFPNAAYCPAFEEFSAFVDRQARTGTPLDTVVVCTPNHLHYPHIQYGLRSGMDVICEKPLVIEPSHLDDLSSLEASTGRRVFSILQLRLHPAIIALKEQLQDQGRVHDVELTYVTTRGPWYHASWKGDIARSGGIAANIGVHFFDMLGFLFGRLNAWSLHGRDADRATGYLEFERARVRWFLSISADDLPENRPEGQTTYRSITVDGAEIEFSGGFTDLHTESYRHILAGEGFGLDDVRPAIELVSAIRHADIDTARGEAHRWHAQSRADV